MAVLRCLLIQVLKWLPEIVSEDSGAVSHTTVQLLHLGYCDAACALLDVLPTPTFETSPSFGAFLIHEMVKTNMVRMLLQVCFVAVTMYGIMVVHCHAPNPVSFLQVRLNTRMLQP
jgi:hypothetical protein